MPLSIGIITEQLQSYGGSEIYILECIKRWQRELTIVIYASQVNRKLFKEFGIDQDKITVKILPKVKNKKHRFDLLDSLVIQPRIWESFIEYHDLYFQYLFPAQLVRKSPSVWFAAEPLRMLYDLHHHETVDESRIAFHVYPRMRYDHAIKSDLNVVLQVIQELDRNSKIENLVTNSRMMEGYLEAIYGRKADLIAYPGINLPEVYDGPVDNRTALFVGRLWEHKRVDLIIKAVSMVPDSHLLVVGDGPEKKNLKKLVRSLRLKRRVRFLGNVDNKRLNQIYRSVTCGIYTPTREPFGIMPLEAASYGMPVIVTQDGGYTEVLDASCAHIVAPEPSCIAHAMDSVFSDHANARRMGAAARRKVEHYTWDYTAASLLKLFKQTLTSQGRVISNPGVRPLLGAHYYVWYDAGDNQRHWNENTDYAAVSDLPVKGPYSSNNGSVITDHLVCVEQAGLDYLVINLEISFNGLNQDELDVVDLLFDIAAKNSPGLSLCFMLTYQQADSKTIEHSLSFLEERYISRPNYLFLKSKPVLWYFITESFVGHFYHHYSKLNESTRDYHCIAASGFCYTKYLPVHYGDYFNGWTLYSPLQISLPKNWERSWKSSYYDFIEDKPDNCIRAFTVCPGFDDTNLTLTQRSHTKYRKITRDDTNTYRRMQDTCLDFKELPDLVVITSFNEFHENTHIEPTVNNKNRYIEATRSFSDQLRSGGGTDPRKSGLIIGASDPKYNQNVS